jgi:sodium/potassium-transporting ATPase subunit alpha
MIGDTKETLGAKTGRPIREIYEDEVSAVVVHGDDIDTLEGWQWDLSKTTSVVKYAYYDANPGVI